MHTILKLTLVLPAFLALVGCATADTMNQVSIGMSKQQVIEAMGAPTSTSAQAGVEYLNYALYETDRAASHGFSTPYFVRLVDGKVNAYGRAGDFGTTVTPVQRIQIETTAKTSN